MCKFKIEGVLTVEAKSKDVSMNPRGVEGNILLIDDVSQGSNICILTSYYGQSIVIDSSHMVAVKIDKNNKVLGVVNSLIFNGRQSNCTKNIKLEIPKDGYVLVANDSKDKENDARKFLAESFKEGDIVKLRLDDEIVGINDLLNKIYGLKEEILLKNEYMSTVCNNEVEIIGNILGMDEKGNYQLEVDGVVIVLEDDKFKCLVALKDGVNYININLLKNNKKIVSSSVIVYKTQKKYREKENILWVDQFPSALQLNSIEDIEQTMIKIKENGFTACCIDVKGPEGYVSYKKNELSHSPYISDIKMSKKRGMDPHRDLLEDFISMSRKHGIKVYVALNVMTEGNLVAEDYPIIDEHLDWEEVLQRPEDKGKLVTVRESNANNIILYVNPAHPEVRRYQLKRYEEVLKNYDIDGVVLDRCRFDNKYADFSELSKVKFGEYLQERGEKLDRWPEDVFKVLEDGSIIEGKHYIKWWAFRSNIINSMAKDIRELVDKYSNIKQRKIELASYVGSWYDTIYENGVNWASSKFRYDDRLGFGEDRIYNNNDYYNTSYIDKLDFIMIGTYYKTAKEINKYITLGNILTREEIPMLAGMSIPDLSDLKIQEDVYQAALNSCEGTMTFDLCYVDWNTIKNSLKNKQKDKNLQKNNKK